MAGRWRRSSIPGLSCQAFSGAIVGSIDHRQLARAWAGFSLLPMEGKTRPATHSYASRAILFAWALCLLTLPEQLAADPLAPRALIDQPSGSNEPFGLATEMVTTGPLVEKWLQIQHKIDDERLTLKICEQSRTSCSRTSLQFLSIVQDGRKLEGRARFGEINRSVNLLIRPISDEANYGEDDFWSSPLTTFARGAGDCEDYAIAKFAALQEAGVSADDLRIIILRDAIRQTYHAVLAARLQGRWHMLDNRHMIMIEDRQVRGYQPIFLLHRRGISLFIGDLRISSSALKPSFHVRGGE